MKTTISVTGMEFYAHHGCFEEERTIGTHFKVDVAMQVAVDEAAEQDDLDKTVNYQIVHQQVEEIMKQPSRLLEHVAYRMMKKLKQEFPLIEHLKVTVYKLNPPLGGKTAWSAVSMED